MIRFYIHKNDPDAIEHAAEKEEYDKLHPKEENEEPAP